MIRIGCFIIFFIFVFFDQHRVWSEESAREFTRDISLDWENISGAKYYDIEISNVQTKKMQKHRTTENKWRGSLPIGIYTLRVCGLDQRKVPGDWSAKAEFNVDLQAPILLEPIKRAGNESGQVSSSENENADQNFLWKPVGGAQLYRLRVESEDGSYSKTEDTKETQSRLKLPVAKAYNWSILSLGAENSQSPEPSQGQFVLYGQTLASPKIEAPASRFVRELSWNKVDWAETYDYQLSRYNKKSKIWEPLLAKQSEVPNFAFLPEWPGGRYGLRVLARAKYREASKASVIAFDVAEGKRTIFAEEIATLRESIDRTVGWFGVASWLLTSYNYSGINSDQSTGTGIKTRFSGAQGGTGRLGLGYLMASKPWGFIGTADYSGLIINSRLINFGSLQLDGVYRKASGRGGEVRHQFGGYYKELPIIIPYSATSSEPLFASALGPHYGFEYWYAINSKIGFQANLHSYIDLITVRTPNKEKLSPDFTYQVGFLASYRLSNKMTGLVGWANRRDSISYKALDSSINSSTLTGNFLNLVLEFQL